MNGDFLLPVVRNAECPRQAKLSPALPETVDTINVATLTFLLENRDIQK